MSKPCKANNNKSKKEKHCLFQQIFIQIFFVLSFIFGFSKPVFDSFLTLHNLSLEQVNKFYRHYLISIFLFLFHLLTTNLKFNLSLKIELF